MWQEQKFTKLQLEASKFLSQPVILFNWKTIKMMCKSQDNWTMIITMQETMTALYAEIINQTSYLLS